MTELRPIEAALMLARERLALLQQGDALEDGALLEALDGALLEASERARADLQPDDSPLVDELLAIHSAAAGLIEAELAETGARIRRLRGGQAGTAAYREASAM